MPELGVNIPVKANDGKLEFEFVKNEDMTGGDAVLSLMGAAFGLPAANMRGLNADQLKWLHAIKEQVLADREFLAAVQANKNYGWKGTFSAFLTAVVKRLPFIIAAYGQVAGTAAGGAAYETFSGQAPRFGGDPGAHHRLRER